VLFIRLMINITFHVQFYSISSLESSIVFLNRRINICTILKMFTYRKMVAVLVMFILSI